LQDIAKGEEFFASYGYSFESGAPWYKELFLEFMAEYPDDPKVKQMAMNRTKEELLKSYDEYVKTIPGSKLIDMSMGGNELNSEQTVSETEKE
jgi:hypothetical protein